jgi:hypothetical protein
MLVRSIAIFALVCSAAILARAASNNLYEIVDPATSLRTLQLVNVHTHNCPNDYPSAYGGDLELLFEAQQLGPHQVEYSLIPNLTGHTRVTIRRGNTMDTLTDGVVGQLTAPINEEAGHIRTHRNITIRETVPFAITREQLIALSGAQVFQFRINGQNISVQRCSYAKDLKNLTDFMNAAATY